MSSAGTVEVARCTSCDAEYAGSYCHSCGEPRPHEGDLALRHLLHEGVHELSHLDGKIWRTIRALLFEPGRLTKAYWEGRRGQWVRPFRLYLTIYVLHLLLLPNVAGPLAFRFAAYRDPAYIFLMLRRIFEQNNWITALKTIPVLLLFVVIELGTAVAIVAGVTWANGHWSHFGP